MGLKMRYEIINGDTSKVISTFSSNTIDLILTSPPYNVGKGYEDKLDFNSYLDFLKKSFKEYPRILSNKGSFILVIDDYVLKDHARSLTIPEVWLYCTKELGLNFIEMYIWNKQHLLPIKSKYRASNIFEYCFHFSKTLNFTFNIDEIRRPYKESTIKRYENKMMKRWTREKTPITDQYKMVKADPRGALPKNILDIPAVVKFIADHPAIFSEKLAAFFIKGFSNKGDNVLDPFLDSGTTMKVAMDLSRNCTGIELNKKYCQISIDRCFKQSKLTDMECIYEEIK